MAFNDLSTELVVEILDGVDRSDLKTLSICCRGLYNVTQPMIYNIVKQTGRETVPKIVRSIIRKPYLTEYIKHLDLSILDRGHQVSDVDTSFISETDKTWIQAQLPETVRGGKDYCDKWLQKLLSGKDNWDTLAGLLLTLCSDTLESIVFRGGYKVGSSTTRTIPNILELASRDPGNCLSKLRCVSFMPKHKQKHDIEYPDRSIDMNLLYSALQTPQVSEIHVTEFDSYTERALFQSPSNKFFATKRLTIARSQLDAGFLENFLTRFDSLTHFTFKEESYYNFAGYRYLIQADIRKCLSNSRHSLESLILQADTRWTEIHADTIQPIGALTEFTALKHLEVDAELLLGKEEDEEEEEQELNRQSYGGVINSSERYSTAQCQVFANGLPDSLERLVVRDCDCSILEPVTELLHSAMPPKLKSIEVCVNFLCEWSAVADVA